MLIFQCYNLPSARGWFDRGNGMKEWQRHQHREQLGSGVGCVASWEGPADWKLSMFILYIWIEETGLLHTDEQGGALS